MKRQVKLAARVALAVACAGGAFAQVPVTAYGKDTVTVRTGSANLGSGVGFLWNAAPGAPYSAQQVIEHTQTMADGTHVIRAPVTSVVFRDSQGRLRIERPVIAGPNAANGPMLIQIRDDVARLVYTLDTQNHIAYRAVMTQPPFVPRPPPRRPIPAGRKMEWTGPDGTEMSSEFLGRQVMEGITVDGVRNTKTTPVGAIGNDRPIVVIEEIWISPELSVTVLDKKSDPLNGEETIRLTNILRGEPDAALFQPPPDYTIVEDNGSSKIAYTIPP